VGFQFRALGTARQFEIFFMRLFMFHCPRTAHVVKGQADDPRPGEQPRTYHPVPCSACEGSHLVDPTTGEIWLHPIKRLGDPASPDMNDRPFPGPWTVDEADACFIVRDAIGLALARVHYEDEPGRRAAANLLTRDEAWRIAAHIAKLPELLALT
jgi:hypothetical protein